MARTNIIQLGRALAKVSEDRARLMELSHFLPLEEVLDIAEKIPLEKWKGISPHSPLYKVKEYSDTFRHYPDMLRAYEAELPRSAFVVSVV